MSNALAYFLLCRSPLHVGCGISLGDIDQPVMRNVVTGHPMVPASTLKGCLKEPALHAWFANEPRELAERGIKSLFGDEGKDSTGLLCPQDAQLLALPVASLAGGWAWVTCPGVLRGLARRLRQCGAAQSATIPEPRRDDTTKDFALVVGSDSPLAFDWGGTRRVALAETPLHAQDSTALRKWARWIAGSAHRGEADAEWRNFVVQRFALVGDEIFDHFCTVATDVRSRNRIGEEGVTDNTALWREECVPEHALFYGSISAQAVPSNPRRWSEADALALVGPYSLQFGAKSTIGYGQAEFIPFDAAAFHAEAP